LKEVRERLDEYFDLDNSYQNPETYTDDQIEEIAEQKLGIKQVYYKEIDVVKNVFFTEAALIEHLNRNRHHYHKPFSYVNHCFRNPEMLCVIDFLKLFTTNKEE
jgi:hypothetical protein